MVPNLPRVLTALLAVTVSCGSVGGCAHPHQTPKLVGGVGTALALLGGVTWAVADGTDTRGLVAPAAGTAAVGLATMLVAGALMAASVRCRADADCPVGEACREVPAPPGGVPYAQCVPRQ